ncbi:UMF1 family MFS transporter [Actinoalloteichus hoggarensis]|uniref:Vacuole effluxer Atg22 like protein n=1 Tax=Actinoalloteichus hoggarensis TaxID=1470176 RepID=A0A221W3G5_9PSEU|nr:MFS transporter [Actinoalloteichus hoggarensis]ASO20410.1 Vacuole effluxer Atg22 like protein [Actinoalloteichus hoggarensis]MBB5923449.1 UMF1 family MFS transporter [Actinoalloteichus hoggarensis]
MGSNVVEPGDEAASSSAQRRREQRGWCWYDWANSVFPTSVITVFLSLYLTEVAESAARASGQPCADGSALVDCDISLWGLSFPAGSLWGYLLSVATVVQVLVLPITGAIADRTQNKRVMLGGFAFAGAAATSALALLAGTNWQLGVVLFILANICFGGSVVVYYSFLPEIADADERDGVSSRGWAFGYLGGGLALAFHLALYLSHEALGLTEAEAVRWCFFTAGLWWAVFTLIPLARLRGHQPPQGSERGVAVFRAGFSQLAQTLREAKSYPLTLGFLAAYLVYNDGIVTVTNVAGQYGERELGLDRTVLITTILIVQFIAFVGAVAHGRAARRFGAKRTIMGSLVLWVLVVGAAFFVEAGQEFQFYGLAVGIGLVLGGTNALSRSLFSQLVPPGREAEYFSVYEVGERATSWLGPLVFAAAGQATGSYRLAIVSLVVFFVVGLILVALVPVRRAIAAVGNRPPTVV